MFRDVQLRLNHTTDCCLVIGSPRQHQLVQTLGAHFDRLELLHILWRIIKTILGTMSRVLRALTRGHDNYRVKVYKTGKKTVLDKGSRSDRPRYYTHTPRPCRVACLAALARG